MLLQDLFLHLALPTLGDLVLDIRDQHRHRRQDQSVAGLARKPGYVARPDHSSRLEADVAGIAGQQEEDMHQRIQVKVFHSLAKGLHSLVLELRNLELKPRIVEVEPHTLAVEDIHLDVVGADGLGCSNPEMTY